MQCAKVCNSVRAFGEASYFIEAEFKLTVLSHFKNYLFLSTDFQLAVSPESH